MDAAVRESSRVVPFALPTAPSRSLPDTNATGHALPNDASSDMPSLERQDECDALASPPHDELDVSSHKAPSPKHHLPPPPPLNEDLSSSASGLTSTMQPSLQLSNRSALGQLLERPSHLPSASSHPYRRPLLHPADSPRPPVRYGSAPNESSHARSIPPFLPPPPPPPHNTGHRSVKRVPGMSLPPPPPPPPQPPKPNSGTFQSQHTGPLSRPSLPRCWSPSDSQSDDLPSLQPAKPPEFAVNIEPFKLPSIPTSEERSFLSLGNPTRRRTSGWPHPDDTNSTSGSSTYSKTRQTDSRPSDSDSDDIDIYVYRNDRQFPPTLPAAQSYRSQPMVGRSSVTNRITNWVAHYERTRSPQVSAGLLSRQPGEPGEPDVADVNASEKSDVSNGEIELLWTRLKENRAQLNETKAQMATKRKELRELRDKKNEADNAFMSVIRPMLANQQNVQHTPSMLLDQRMNGMQTLRSEYHFQETEYENLELQLDKDEIDLNNLETRFFSLLAAGRTKPARTRLLNDGDDTDQRDGLQGVPIELRGISADGPTETPHPLYSELLSVIGDLNNAKEEYDDLLYVRDQYLGDRESGRPLSADSDEEREFMSEFPTESVRMAANITALEGTVSALKRRCEEEGAMKRNLSPQVTYLLYPDAMEEEIELDDVETILQSQTGLEHHKFPVLLSQPEHLLATDGPHTSRNALRIAANIPKDDPEHQARMQVASKEFAIDQLMPDFKDDGKAHLVSRWLLHQLRTSALHANLLYATFMINQRLKIRDIWRWQSDVLYYWWHDKCNNSIGEAAEHMTSADSEFSVRSGTPQRSRAASEGGGNYSYERISQSRQRRNSNDGIV